MKLIYRIGAGILCSAIAGMAAAQETTTTTTTTSYQVFKVCDSEMDIYSSDNVSVGRIDSIVVEPEGRIVSVLATPAAQLGVQGELVVVPYTGARVTSNRLVVTAARDVIVKAPTISRTEIRTVAQPTFVDR